MSTVWGSKFASNIGDQNIMQILQNEWFRALSNFTDDEIEYAIVDAVDEKEFPPSIAEFRHIIFDKRDTDSAKRSEELKQLRYETRMEEEMRLDAKIDKKKRAENSSRLAELARKCIKRI